MKPPIPIPVAGLEWLPQLLQTGDSIFPTGSYAHSFGLEGLVELGHVADADAFAAFIHRQFIPALENFELPFVRFTHDAALDADLPRLATLDERYGAMKGAAELREASVRIGSQRLQMLLRLQPHPLLSRLDEERAAGRFRGHAVIVFGAQTAIAGVPLEAALISHYYQSLASLVSAAIKLIRMGQSAAQAHLAGALAGAGAVVERARRVAGDDAGWFQPALDVASARHESAYTRLFIS